MLNPARVSIFVGKKSAVGIKTTNKYFPRASIRGARMRLSPDTLYPHPLIHSSHHQLPLPASGPSLPHCHSHSHLSSVTPHTSPTRPLPTSLTHHFLGGGQCQSHPHIPSPVLPPYVFLRIPPAANPLTRTAAALPRPRGESCHTLCPEYISRNSASDI